MSVEMGVSELGDMNFFVRLWLRRDAHSVLLSTGSETRGIATGWRPGRLYDW